MNDGGVPLAFFISLLCCRRRSCMLEDGITMELS